MKEWYEWEEEVDSDGTEHYDEAANPVEQKGSTGVTDGDAGGAAKDVVHESSAADEVGGAAGVHDAGMPATAPIISPTCTSSTVPAATAASVQSSMASTTPVINQDRDNEGSEKELDLSDAESSRRNSGREEARIKMPRYPQSRT